MKASDSGRSERFVSGVGTEDSGLRDQESGIRGAGSKLLMRVWFGIPGPIILLVAAYVIAHVAMLPPSLEDIDSINFALGLRHFDVASHQPHPPGYPVYIALGRVSLLLIHAVAPSLDVVRSEAMALAIWSALGGGVALLAAWAVFVEVGRRRPPPRTPGPLFKVGGISFWATALLAASPLFWISGMRPLSDMPGLAMALVAQACALKGLTDRKALIIAAVVAGIAAGMRVQTVCLTVPILVFALWNQRSAGAWWLLSRPLGALVAGALAWAIPLIAFSGGLEGYLHALG